MNRVRFDDVVIDSSVKVNFVIPTFHRQANIIPIVTSVASLGNLVGSILIFDNASSADLRDQLVLHAEREHLPIEYVPSTNVGPAGAMAYAMSEFTERGNGSDWLLRLDDDCIPDVAELRYVISTAVAMRGRSSLVASVGLQGAVWEPTLGQGYRFPSETSAHLLGAYNPGAYNKPEARIWTRNKRTPAGRLQTRSLQWNCNMD